MKRCLHLHCHIMHHVDFLVKRVLATPNLQHYCCKPPTLNPSRNCKHF